MKLPPIRHSYRGSVLVMTIFFLVILFFMASSFITLLPVESREARRTELQTQGALTAEAGLIDALTWLRFQLAQVPSKEPMQSNVYPSQSNRTVSVGDGWTYRWELVPDAQTYPNGSNPIRGYTIVCKSFRDGESQSIVRAEVLQRSLTGYTQLYDEWPSNLIYGIRTSDVQLAGKVHSNTILNLWIPEGNTFWNSTGDPIFAQGVTAAKARTDITTQDGFGYYQGNWSGSDSNKLPYNSGGAIAERYARIAVGGRDAVQTGVPEVPLPANTFNLEEAGWGFNAANPKPTANGVYVNTEGGVAQGVFIKGDVKEMQLGFGGSQPVAGQNVSYGDNSWVKIELPIANQRRIDYNENVTVVTVKETPVVLPTGANVNGTVLTGSMTVPVGSTLVRRANGRLETYSGNPNGLVYTDGNVENLWGINKGRRTIATEGTKKIVIGGREVDKATDAGQASPATLVSSNANEKGLLQFGLTDTDSDGVLDPPTTASHSLGLVSKDVMISRRLRDSGNNWDLTNPKTNPLYLFAAVLGGINGSGTYAVESYNTGNTNGGWAYCYGASIMANAGAWAVTTGQGLSHGTTFFDGPASLNPPPYFPGEPSFAIKSYEEERLIGETI